jgi:hypothetical protein
MRTSPWVTRAQRDPGRHASREAEPTLGDRTPADRRLSRGERYGRDLYEYWASRGRDTGLREADRPGLDKCRRMAP